MVTPTTLISQVSLPALAGSWLRKKSNALLLADCATKFVCMGTGVSAGALGGATTNAKLFGLIATLTKKWLPIATKGYSFSPPPSAQIYQSLFYGSTRALGGFYHICYHRFVSNYPYWSRLANGHHHTVISPLPWYAGIFWAAAGSMTHLSYYLGQDKKSPIARLAV